MAIQFTPSPAAKISSNPSGVTLPSANKALVAGAAIPFTPGQAVTFPQAPAVQAPAAPALSGQPVIGKGLGFGVGPGVGPVTVNPKVVVDTVKDTVGSLKTEFGGGPDSVGSKLINDVSEGAKDIQNGDVVKGVAKAGLRTAGDVAGAVFAPVSAAVGAVVKNTGAQGVIDWLGKEGANLSHVADIPAVQQFALAHPNAGEDFGRALNLILAGGEKGKIEPSTVVERTAEQVAPALEKAKATITEAPGKVKAIVKPAVDANRVAGTITQGDLADIPTAKKVLANVDPAKIKTYADLSKALNTNLTDMKAGQDAHTAASDVVKKLPDLTTTTKVGDSSVTHNYVSDALDQLKNLYQKINDPAAEAKIDQLKTKAETDGLNSTDVNAIAREHGRVLNAFNANGEASTGLTKQAAENTRVGLKTTAGELSGDAKTFSANDKAISDTIKVKDLVDTMSEKVNDLKQKIQDRGFGEKVGRVLGQAINLVGLNSPKGFVEYFLGRGTGLKTLNPLDLEGALQKNLKALQDVVNDKTLSESQVQSKVQKIVSDHQVNDKNQSLKRDETSIPKKTKTLTITKKANSDAAATSKNVIPKSVSQAESEVKPSKGIIQKIKDTPNKQGGFIKIPTFSQGASVAEKGTMRDFMDMISGEYKPDAKTAAQLKSDAQDLATKYKFNKAFSGDKALSSAFGKYLNRVKFNK